MSKQADLIIIETVLDGLFERHIQDSGILLGKIQDVRPHKAPVPAFSTPGDFGDADQAGGEDKHHLGGKTGQPGGQLAPIPQPQDEHRGGQRDETNHHSHFQGRLFADTEGTAPVAVETIDGLSD